MTLVDLNMVWIEKLTKARAWYWLQEEMVLLREHGVNANKGAADHTVPCFQRQTKAATKIARKRLEKTQKAAEGKRPEGVSGVGVNFVLMMSSCITPQTK